MSESLFCLSRSRVKHCRIENVQKMGLHGFYSKGKTSNMVVRPQGYTMHFEGIITE